MNHTRVNLLKKSEQRYQGAVSGKFIAISAVALPVFIIVLVAGLRILKINQVKSGLAESQTLWEELEPQYKSFNTENKDFGTSKKMVEMFDAWKESGLHFDALMGDIQMAVPGNIEFSRLSVRSGNTRTAFASPKEIDLSYILVIEGNAHGGAAEQQVFGLQKNLLEKDNVASSFDSLEAAYIRKRGKAGGKSMREFRLEGGAAGGAK